MPLNPICIVNRCCLHSSYCRWKLNFSNALTTQTLSNILVQCRPTANFTWCWSMSVIETLMGSFTSSQTMNIPPPLKILRGWIPSHSTRKVWYLHRTACCHVHAADSARTSVFARTRRRASRCQGWQCVDDKRRSDQVGGCIDCGHECGEGSNLKNS
jgi:hypothetical protein